MRLAASTLVVFVATVFMATSAFAAALTCPNTMRVSVLVDGNILVNGSKVTLESLDKQLGELKGQRGTVWYYREAAGREPAAAQGASIKDVLGLIMKYGVPVSFSSTADFSDVIDGSGESSPRTKC